MKVQKELNTLLSYLDRHTSSRPAANMCNLDGNTCMTRTGLGIATETEIFGPDRKSRPTEWTGRCSLSRTEYFGPTYAFSLYCRDRPTELSYNFGQLTGPANRTDLQFWSVARDRPTEQSYHFGPMHETDRLNSHIFSVSTFYKKT
jgi:hypothetical protein